MKTLRSFLALLLLVPLCSQSMDAPPTYNPNAPAQEANKVGGFLVGALGAAAFAAATKLPVVQDAITATGMTLDETKTILSILTPLFTFGMLGSKESMFFAKWGIIAAAIIKFVHSYPGMFVLHNLPLIGDKVITEEELGKCDKNGVTSETAFKLNFIVLALFNSLQRYLIATYPGPIQRLGMQPV